MTAEVAIYDAMTEPLDEITEATNAAYLNGVRDGMQYVLGRITWLRYNPASLWLSPPIEGVKDQTVFLRVDHLDEVLGSLRLFANQGRTLSS